MTNVEALKACYVAIGGSAADVADAKTTAAVIEAISTIASGGGGGGGGGVTGLKVFNLETTIPQHDIVLDFGMTWAQLLDLMRNNMVLVSYVDELSYAPDTVIYSDMLSMATHEGLTYFKLTIAGISTSVSEADMGNPAYLRVAE